MNAFALGVWIAVAVSSLLLGFGLWRAMPRTADPAPRLHDLSEAAFLTGGPGGVVDTALVSLLSDGRMVAGGPGIVQVLPGARAADPAERAVLRAYPQAPSGWLYQVRYAAMIDPSVQETGDALAHRGLLAPPGWGRAWRRWGRIQAAVCAALLFLWVLMYLFEAGSGSGDSVILGLYPTVLVVGIVVGVECARRPKRRITPAGQRALHGMRALYGGDGSPQVRTALFGLPGLQDPYLRSLLVPAARDTRLAAAQHRSRHAGSGAAGSPRRSGSDDGCGSSAPDAIPVVWCASSDTGGSGSGCGSSGSSCGGGSGSSSGSGSSCSSSSGSSCSSSSGSSCSSSSGSSCSSSSSSS
ncbi:TIGR04222 domain-containing membrane protein [Streptomyces sp. NPDC090445]|uniref:TIGR04222 domain-containing membrane protein n=1 Tax=Streptomyces sp. NPDC090445 TaxID=3365963 RepID=UPI00382E4B69